MAMDAPALEREKTAGQKPGIVDCDVHPTIATGLNALFPYMPDAWRRRFERKGAGALPVGLTLRFAHPNGAVVREDARNEAGAVGGSDPAFLASKWLKQAQTQRHGRELACPMHRLFK